MMLYGPRGILNLARARERKDGERGQIMVLFTLVVVLLMVLAAVVIDAGLLRTDSARLQNALDAGALAAARSLPANSANQSAVKGTAISYAEANFPGLGLGPNDITFRCILGADPTTGLPRLIDMPAVCNVPAASAWVCTAALCWAPCDPVAGNVCNTVVVTDSVTRDYTFGRAAGINSGSTGAMQSAACTGPCGPTMPVDVVLTIDRTVSMQGLEQTLVNGANAVLQAYDPLIQHVALGMIGPSSQITACSTGAMGKILENGTLTAPTVESSHPTGTNVSAGATTLVINKPTSTAAGDLMLAGITVDGGSGTTITPPAGWQLIRRTDNGTNVGQATYSRLATAADGSVPSYTWGLSPSARASGGIFRLTGVDTVQPIDLSSGNTGSGTTLTATGVTTTVDDTTLVGFFSPDSNSAVTPSGGSPLTEQFDVAHPNALGPRTEGATRTTASTAGATGNKTATITASAPWAAQLIAVRPMPVESYPVPYPTTTPPYTDTFLRDNMSKWIPVGLTGTVNADVIESYRNADGSVNTSSTISKTIRCVLPPNDLYMGTDQASPFDFARAHLMGTSVTPAHARPTVTTGIIFETDGTPQTENYTCQQAQTAASAAKAAGIEVFTIGYFASNGPNQNCPDSSGFWHGKKVIQSLAAMATNSATVSTTSCDANENTDGDHFFCTPDSDQITNVFRSAALALAGGSRLVQLYPQPIVTSVSASCGVPAGGGTVNINGRFFTEAYSVTFNGTKATSFTVLSDTSIQAVAPAGTAHATRDIQVSTPGGSSKIVGADQCTYGP